MKEVTPMTDQGRDVKAKAARAWQGASGRMLLAPGELEAERAAVKRLWAAVFGETAAS